MATFATEFPDFPASDMPAIPATFADTSWHNNACPSITSDAFEMHIWIDYADTALREFTTDRKRFLVEHQKAGIETGHDILETDSWDEVLAVIAEIEAIGTMTAIALNDWYEKTVGYRPQVDSPTMTDRELRDLCKGYVLASRE